MLESACGYCQNRTFISWSDWKFFCPTMLLSDQGVFPEAIPEGTRVPHWAYIKPSDNDDFFDALAAKLVGGALRVVRMIDEDDYLTRVL